MVNRILFTKDDSRLSELFRRGLEAQFYMVEVAYDGQLPGARSRLKTSGSTNHAFARCNLCFRSASVAKSTTRKAKKISRKLVFS